MCFRFNPRAHVGRDDNSPSNTDPKNVVSIHAPMWGATRQIKANKAGEFVSIHAPMWGATSEKPDTEKPGTYVSIHAPMWGAT